MLTRDDDDDDDDDVKGDDIRWLWLTHNLVCQSLDSIGRL